MVQFGPDAEPLDTQCVNITIVKDGVAEDYEELTVSIDVTPDFFDVLIDTATITIYDHDCYLLRVGFTTARSWLFLLYLSGFQVSNHCVGFSILFPAFSGPFCFFPVHSLL